jgi:cell wall-associated NlpC family hydrolase
VNWWGRYVGLPFEDGGRGPETVDCWGLLRLVYAEQRGIDLPSYGEISAHDLLSLARKMGEVKDYDCWQPVTDPQEFDAVIMRPSDGRNSIIHVGTMIDAKRMLHVEQASAAVIVPIRHYSVTGRISGFRRYK